MHITDQMIDTELRGLAKAYRAIHSHITPGKMKFFTNVLKNVNGIAISKESLNYDQHYIPRYDGSTLRICVYYPKTPQKNVPGILWLHGGGYAMSVPEVEVPTIKQLVAKSGAVVVVPEYRLSTEAPYPAALEDSYLALQWLAKHGAEYGMRDDQIMVGGSSAGGGLTAALTLYVRDRGEINIAFQMPLYPMIDDRLTGSSTDNDAPFWNTESNELGWRLYLGDLYGSENISPYAVPARADNFTNLPPTVTFIGSVEPFRDETITYVQRLKESGVQVYFKEYQGAFHAFDLFKPNATISKKATAFLMETFEYAVEHYFAKQPE
ncbi:alpha/beta hydrolase fold domain-containing protein [Ligilactobacillus pobuzihii]|uniref:alpha/beta hydrolase n=1 Tax=Ligilactobacillus pobuzihii TaxID=449659 RepID=UPI0019D18C6F|nr:alpha/beta hydrolase [Ligilactobacillus pobuzihii]MBN7274062.1 alpha/beta hydrolase fold domain-containing protein [Ligilactobacillus pobuzihii]